MHQSYSLRQSLLSRRLLIYVFVCALLFSILSTAVQLIIGHRKSLAGVDKTFDYIESGYLDSIAASVFALDEEQIRLQLIGMLNFPNITYAKVVEQRGDALFQIEEGDAQASRDIIRTFELKYTPPAQEVSSFGQLTVSASLLEVYGRLFDSGLIAFATSVAGLGIVSLCIFLIFQFSLTRHLTSMCEYTDKLNLNELDSGFELHRRPPLLWRKDELHQLAAALNNMRLRLKQDLLEIKNREEKLEAFATSLRRYEQIISSTNDLMSFVDKDYIYQAVNNAYLKAHAKTRNEIVGFSVEQLIGNDAFLAIAKENLDRALGGEVIQYQSWFDYAGIGRRFMDVVYNPFKDKHGNTSGVVVSVHDLTERKQAEEAMSLFFDQSLVMLYVADMRKSTLIRVNKEVSRITGRTEAELVSMPFIEFVHPDDREHALKAMDQLSQGNPLAGYRGRHLTAAGDERIFEWHAVPDMERKLLYAMARDITDQQKAEAEREHLQAQLLQAQKMESIGRLAGGVAHDFNNMLSIILGNTELVLTDMREDNPILPKMREIEKAAERSAELTQQLLAFARKQTIAPKVLNLNKAVQGLLNMLGRLIGEDIELTWLPKSDLWPIKIDPFQIDQVLTNLCINARDAIQDIGKITIETDNVIFDRAYCREHPECRPGDYVMVAVSDDGCGIAREDLDKLFEPFFTTKEVGKGTGLGLATVYGIMKQNSGFINVYSEHGIGTTLKIYLPRYVEELLPEQDPHVHKTARNGYETILVVEDEQAILSMTTMMLEHLGYKTISAASPSEAIELVESFSGEINLLMTDVIMPEMSGRVLAEKLVCNYPQLKCLYMSGYPANVIVHHGVLDKGVQFINKPFTISELSAKIRQALVGPDGASP